MIFRSSQRAARRRSLGLLARAPLCVVSGLALLVFVACGSPDPVQSDGWELTAAGAGMTTPAAIMAQDPEGGSMVHTTRWCFALASVALASSTLSATQGQGQITCAPESAPDHPHRVSVRDQEA